MNKQTTNQGDGTMRGKARGRLAILCGALCAMVGALFMTGCKDGNETEAQKIARISATIRIGTSSATAIGLVAVPNQDEAMDIAKEAARALDEEVFPLLAGDEGGIASVAEQLLRLKAFENEKLAKFKAILEAALPTLQSNLPGDLLDKQLDQWPADVKAYITAFFNGVRDGVGTYMDTGRGSIDCKKLRETLSK